MQKRPGGTLTVKDLVKRFGKRTVVKKVSFQVESGHIVGLLGPNGAGKTTTFYMVAGLLRPDEGNIFLNDIDLSHDPMYKRARRGIVYLPQEPSVFRRLSVAENVLLVLEERGLPQTERAERLERLLHLFGLGHLRAQKAYSLSGGERRRVEIMRALACDPLFLLLDEPFAGIDPLAISGLKELVQDLRNRGLGILISDHNVRETLEVCDYAYIVAEGQVIAEGSPTEIAANEIARKLYLGEDFSF